MNLNFFIEDKSLILEITEELDHHSSEKIRKRVDYEIQRFMPKKVIFDFKYVNFMDSAGIGLVLGRYKQAEAYGGKLELINVNEKLRKIFDMSGVSKIIEISGKKDIKKIS